MLFHDSEVEGTTRREASMPQDHLFGTLRDALRDVKHLIGHAEESVERRLDGVPPVDGDVPI